MFTILINCSQLDRQSRHQCYLGTLLAKRRWAVSHTLSILTHPLNTHTYPQYSFILSIPTHTLTPSQFLLTLSISTHTLNSHTLSILTHTLTPHNLSILAYSTGWTVWLERKIMSRVKGPEFLKLSAQGGHTPSHTNTFLTPLTHPLILTHS